MYAASTSSWSSVGMVKSQVVCYLYWSDEPYCMRMLFTSRATFLALMNRIWFGGRTKFEPFTWSKWSYFISKINCQKFDRRYKSLSIKMSEINPYYCQRTAYGYTCGSVHSPVCQSRAWHSPAKHLGFMQFGHMARASVDRTYTGMSWCQPFQQTFSV